jgi:serine/threonine-protein kinase
VQGGTALTLCENSAGSGDRGASWGEDGTIIAALDIFHLCRVPDAGGKQQMLPVKAEDTSEIAYRWPQILPGGGAVLATVGVVGGFEDATIAVVSLKTGEVKKILSGGYYGRYLPNGHLIYLHQDTLFAVPFDLRRMETRGTPAPVQQEVGGNAVNGSGQLDFSLTGTLVYVSGQNLNGVGTLAWLDATGKRVPLLLNAPTSTPRLSPDGKRLAISMTGDIFNYDLQRGVMGRITFDGAGNRWPVWTPDGKYIDYAPWAGWIWWARADGSLQPQRILETKGVTGPQSFSPDGRRLAYLHTGEGMLVLPLDTSDPDHPKPGKPGSVASAQGAFHYGAFSPDGRWLAIASAEANSYQVYVRPYPAVSAGGKWQISTVPGRYPVWSRKGHELFYETMDGHVMVTNYTTKGDTFTPGTPRRWTETPLVSIGAYPNFDMSPDGQRIVAMVAPDAWPREKGPIHAIFLVNVFDELKRKLP